MDSYSLFHVNGQGRDSYSLFHVDGQGKDSCGLFHERIFATITFWDNFC